MKKFNYILIITFVFCTYSCKDTNKPVKTEIPSSTIKYAKGFDILTSKNVKKLIIKLPYPNATESFEYVLVSKKTGTNVNEIQIPINSVVVTSTTHIPFLELLNVENKLVGYPNTDYISSPKTRALIKQGKIKELGNEESINTELLLDLNPNIVIGFSINSNNKMFANIEKMGVPVIFNSDWLEETPLGRAEWIKFFGVLFGKEKMAQSIFNAIEKDYLEAKSIAANAKDYPTLLSGGLFKDVWNLPAGESYEATFYKDAHTNYLWKDSKGMGSLALNIENVFEKGKNAEIWISPSYHTSLEELKTTNAMYSQFKAFKTNNIYSFMNRKGEKGGVMYYEMAPARPDLVLKDYIKIFHPELLTDYKLNFFDKLQ